MRLQETTNTPREGVFYFLIPFTFDLASVIAPPTVTLRLIFEGGGLFEDVFDASANLH